LEGYKLHVTPCLCQTNFGSIFLFETIYSLGQPRSQYPQFFDIISACRISLLVKTNVAVASGNTITFIDLNRPTKLLNGNDARIAKSASEN
jgi:hypothetical protein